MAQPLMRLFMHEDRPSAAGIILLGHHHVSHPTERSSNPVRQHQNAPVSKRYTPAAARHSHNPHDVAYGPSQRRKHPCKIDDSEQNAPVERFGSRLRLLYYHQVPGIVGDSVFEYHVPPEIIFRNHVDPGGGYPGQLLLDGNYTQRQQKRQQQHSAQQHPVHPMQRIAAQQQLVKQVEDRQASRSLQTVKQKGRHRTIVFRFDFQFAGSGRADRPRRFSLPVRATKPPRGRNCRNTCSPRPSASCG